MAADVQTDLEEGSIEVSELTFDMVVGCGSVGEVSRGRYKGELVAIKRIGSERKQLYLDPEKLVELKKELAILSHLASLNHPHLVRFIGHVTKPNLMLVVEFCGGSTLFEILHQCDHIELSWAQCGEMSTQIASALDYLHGAAPRIVHRDVKSANIMLAQPVYGPGDEPDIKVSDFGVSKVLAAQEGDGMAKMTLNVGTCAWMAPEVFVSDSYNEKVDVYSYGMVLFEIICRREPFSEVPGEFIVSMVSSGERPDYKEHARPDCPELVIELMKQCWAQDPESRPPFSEVLMHLQQLDSEHGAKPL
mmetsp:Transcript_135895/g.290447  ORF Transcript_135895/g.290447 Transcript_135895/m.290447 type:complete len:305 (-) Transcript_135895:26-940(-)